MVIGEEGFHGVYGDVAPLFLNEGAHSVEAWARVFEAVGFVRGKLWGEIMVGMQDAVGVGVGKLCNAVWADFDVGNLVVG